MNEDRPPPYLRGVDLEAPPVLHPPAREPSLHAGSGRDPLVKRRCRKDSTLYLGPVVGSAIDYAKKERSRAVGWHSPFLVLGRSAGGRHPGGKPFVS